MTGYDFKSSNTQGPIVFGATGSGQGGPVQFGGNAPGAAATALSSVTANPIVVIAVAAAVLVGVWIWRR